MNDLLHHLFGTRDVLDKIENGVTDHQAVLLDLNTRRVTVPETQNIVAIQAY